MSVHSTYYEDPDEYEHDLAWEYRVEGRVRTSKRKNIPSYEEVEEEDDQVINNHSVL